jgi:bifunctional NMN adenylyltransferase/nudix hydrolase
VLGVPHVEATFENFLSYTEREHMIKEKYPNVVCLPLKDERDDKVWDDKLDSLITLPFGKENDFTLYGSRDSFLKTYKGKFNGFELEDLFNISATEVRLSELDKPLDGYNKRLGKLHGISSQRPHLYSTVDIACIKNGHVLLGRKPNENKLRLIGGFVDTTDDSIEMAAKREFGEEVHGLEVTNFKYITSMKVDDYRYRRSKNGIMTHFYTCDYIFGNPQANDDICHVEFISLEYLKENLNIIVSEHQKLIQHIL